MLNDSGIVYASSQKAAPNIVRGNDLYETPPCAVLSLLANVPDMQLNVWEPCAGRGAIGRVLSERGHRVFMSDKFDYGEQNVEVRDFFDFQAPPYPPFLECCIVTNPPYMRQLPAKMALHGLKLVPRIFFLLRLAFLEGSSLLRRAVLDSGHLKTVYVYRDRLPRMHRDGWKGNQATATTAFAWFEWCRYFSGPPTIVRINSKDTP